MKAQAQQTSKAKAGAPGTGAADHSQQRMQIELTKQLRDVEREAGALELRIAQLQGDWEGLQQQRATKDQEVHCLQQQQEQLRQQMESSAGERYVDMSSRIPMYCIGLVGLCARVV